MAIRTAMKLEDGKVIAETTSGVFVLLPPATDRCKFSETGIEELAQLAERALDRLGGGTIVLEWKP